MLSICSSIHLKLSMLNSVSLALNSFFDMAPWYKPKALFIYLFIFPVRRNKTLFGGRESRGTEKGWKGLKTQGNKLYNDPGYQFIPPFSYKPNNKSFPNFPLTFSATKHNDFFTNFSSTSSETKIKPFNNKCMSIIGITKAN